MKIIINCDDLGASDQVNESIFSLMGRRLVTSATLLINFPKAEVAANRLHKYPHCSFGVHLNITGGRPLSRHPGLGPLLNENGEFANNIRRIPITSSLRHAVFAEWCAQLEHAIALGVPISHLDSHHHTHCIPGLFGALKGVQRKFNIRKVRITQNLAGSSEVKSSLLLVSKFLWNLALRNFYQTKTTDSFTSFATFYERLLESYPLKGTYELMCHPGSDKYQSETELLCGHWNDLVSSDVQLISYNEL